MSASIEAVPAGPAGERLPGPGERAHMHRHGWLSVPGFFGTAEVERLLAWTCELAAAPEVSGGPWIYREESLKDPGVRVIQRIENFCPHHAGFDAFIRDGALARWTRELMHGPVVLFKDKINFKMPGGGGFKLHQDQQAGWTRYAPLFVTALVTLDAATRENGCLEIERGPRRKELLGPEWEPLAAQGLALEPVPTAPGDVIFFDSFVPHASAPNLTDSPRRILYLTWNLASAGDQRARYYANKYANFPPDIDREQGKNYVFRV